VVGYRQFFYRGIWRFALNWFAIASLPYASLPYASSPYASSPSSVLSMTATRAQSRRVWPILNFNKRMGTLWWASTCTSPLYGKLTMANWHLANWCIVFWTYIFQLQIGSIMQVIQETSNVHKIRVVKWNYNDLRYNNNHLYALDLVLLLHYFTSIVHLYMGFNTL